jgi:hypothetical protein
MFFTTSKICVAGLLVAVCGCSAVGAEDGMMPSDSTDTPNLQEPSLPQVRWVPPEEKTPVQETVPVEPPAPTPSPTACDAADLTSDPAPQPRECDFAGVSAEAYCLGGGMTGFRVCGDDGTYGDAVCPSGQEPIDRRATYLVLTREMFAAALDPFVAMKTMKGETVQVVDAARIVDAGDTDLDVPARVREFLRRVRVEAAGAKYLLIVGAPKRDTTGRPVYGLTEPWEIPKRYASVYPGTKGALHGTASIASDDYYASVQVDWPTDTDADWLADFDFRADFYVGRVSARDVAYVENWVAKQLAWVTPKAPTHSLFDTFACQSGGHAEHDAVYQQLGKYTHRMVEHRCRGGETGNHFDFANADKADFVSSFYHGSINSTGGARDDDGNPMGYSLSVVTPGGFEKPPVFFAHACVTASDDYFTESLAENLVGRKDGVVAYVGFNRTAWNMRFPLWDYVFVGGYTTLGAAVYEGKRERLRDLFLGPFDVNNLLMLSLHGDPGLEIVDPAVRLTVAAASDERRADGGTLHACLKADSKLAEPLEGKLATNGVAGEVAASLTATPGSSLVNADFSYVDNGFTQENLVGFTGCDVEKTSCIMARVRIVPTVPMVCRNLKTGPDGVSKGFDVRFDEPHVGPVTLALIAQPGKWYPEGCAGACPYEPEEPASWEIDDVKAGTMQVAFVPEFKSDVLPPEADRGNGSYRNPLVGAEVRNPDGSVLGRCWINADAELDLAAQLAK